MAHQGNSILQCLPARKLACSTSSGTSPQFGGYRWLPKSETERARTVARRSLSGIAPSRTRASTSCRTRPQRWRYQFREAAWLAFRRPPGIPNRPPQGSRSRAGRDEHDRMADQRRPGALPSRRLGAMEARVAAIRAGTAPELVWLLEHPPLYTAGTSAQAGRSAGSPTASRSTPAAAAASTPITGRASGWPMSCST